MLSGDLNGKEIQKKKKKEGIYVYAWLIHFAVTAETNRML